MSQLELILQRVGAFGKWQRVQFAILAPSAIFISWQSFLYIFITYVSLDQPCESNETWIENCNNESCGIMERNFVTRELNKGGSIICLEPILKASIQSIFFFGFILGVLCFYQLAKNAFCRIGRKRTALSCIILLTICGSVASQSHFYLVFIGLRFFSGIFVAGLQLAVLFMSFEMTGIVYHPWLLCLWNCASTIGYILLAAIAASFSNWTTIYLVSSVPVIVLMSYSCLIPESAKWLLTKGRKADTERLLRKMALTNGHILRHESVHLNAKEIVSYRRYTRKHITKDRKMLFWSFSLAILWICHEFAYQVISLTLPRMESNLQFVAHVLSGFIEFPAIFAALICGKLFRRRLSMAIFCGFCTIFCVISASIPQKFPLWIVVSCIFGKLGLFSSYVVLQIFTVEMYPDELRLMMLLTFTLASKFGAMAAPFVEITLDLFPFLPFACSSVASCSAFLVIYFLPETFGRQIYGTTINEPKANINKEETDKIFSEKRENDDEMEEQIELKDVKKKLSKGSAEVNNDEQDNIA